MRTEDPTPKLSRKSSIKTDLEKVQKLMKVVSHSQSSKLKESKRKPYESYNKPMVKS